MESFSWSDSLRALTASCIACLRSSKSERNDLDDLLVESGSATTADAETLSLHSNPGVLAQRRRHSRFGKSIRLFGWDLFGRRQPIRLPDDEEEEEGEGEGEEVRRGEEQQQREARKKKVRRLPPTAISSSTLDSDAAPLDSAAIVSHATKHAEEEEARAARRARRRERKERKQAALALALQHAAVLNGDGEFEGFPGSGERRATANPSSSIDERDSTDARTPPLRHVPYQDDDDEDEDEEGDFGAGAYARRTPGSSDSGRGSDSRSRTSTSLSGARSAHAVQPYNHHYISQQPSARPTARAPQPPPPPARRTSKNKSSRSSSSSKRTRSSPSASQSPSIASPVASHFSDAVHPPSPLASAVPRAGQEFDGFKNGPSPLHTAGIERLSSGFPSPGLGGPRNGKRDMGAFLANRGDN